MTNQEETYRELLETEREAHNHAKRRLVEVEERQRHDRVGYEKRLKLALEPYSQDGKIVLASLEQALNLIRQYQRSLWILRAYDPQYMEADGLLQKWGMKGNDKMVNGVPVTTWEEEQEEWGDEGTGEATMELVAERTGEGDKVYFREKIDDPKIDPNFIYEVTTSGPAKEKDRIEADHKRTIEAFAKDETDDA